MTATVTVEVARRDDVLMIPTTALRFKPDAALLAKFAAAAPAARAKSPIVWVTDGTQLTAKPVAIGASDATHTEIVNGSLAEGTRVVTRGASAGVPAKPAVAASGNPLMPSRPGPPR